MKRTYHTLARKALCESSTQILFLVIQGRGGVKKRTMLKSHPFIPNHSGVTNGGLRGWSFPPPITSPETKKTEIYKLLEKKICLLRSQFIFLLNYISQFISLHSMFPVSFSFWNSRLPYMPQKSFITQGINFVARAELTSNRKHI